MTEEELGAAMLALARKEGHAPQPIAKVGAPKTPTKRTPPQRMAGPGTIAMMRALAQGPANTRVLAELAGITPNEAGWRLKALRTRGYVDSIGRDQHITTHVAVWALGKRGPMWLRKYGINVEAAE